MSGDEERRKRERKALAHVDASAAAAVERDQARVGQGVIGFLEELVGRTVYVEGVRINYRGVLKQVLRHGDGTPAGLVMQPCQRVSYFNRRGPDQSYVFTHTQPRLVPYEVVHDVGEEGFAEGAWPGVKS
jgi:hypothetical protein